MPMVWALLAGFALRGWGVVGLLTWTLGTVLVYEIVASNVSSTAGSWSQILFAGGLFVWTISQPTESEAKLGFLRALRLLVGLCMIATGVIGRVALAFHGFRFSGSGAPVWLPLGASAICASILFAFRKWLALDETRSSRP